MTWFKHPPVADTFAFTVSRCCESTVAVGWMVFSGRLLNIVELRFSVIVTSITEPEAEELGATLDAEGLGETELELSANMKKI